jgi:hypothetical protein
MTAINVSLRLQTDVKKCSMKSILLIEMKFAMFFVLFYIKA